MHIRIEGTAPGVEWGKELSLSVEEWSSPKSCSPWADADGPQPVTFLVSLGGLQIWKPQVESNLHLKAVWFLSSLGQNPQVKITMHGVIYFS